MGSCMRRLPFHPEDRLGPKSITLTPEMAKHNSRINIFDHTHSEAQARIRLKQLQQDIHALEDRNLEKILTFLDDHWEQALRYLRKKGMGTHRRGSNSESGMRLLRRLEKNHDGIRSATTRQHSIQIYQAIKYLSLDVADFIEKGPQMTGPPRV